MARRHAQSNHVRVQRALRAEHNLQYVQSIKKHPRFSEEFFQRCLGENWFHEMITVATKERDDFVMALSEEEFAAFQLLRHEQQQRD